MTRHRLITALGIAALLLAPTSDAPAAQLPAAKAYELEVKFVPDAELDFAALTSILHRGRSHHRENSTRKYPYLEGKAAITIGLGDEPIESLALYLHGELRAQSIRLRDEDVPYEQETVFYEYDYSSIANRIDVDLGGLTGEIVLHIEYAGFFHPSYARGAGDYMRIDSEGVYLRAYGYSLWFPVTLESRGSPLIPADFDSVRITTPRSLTAVFTGQRIREYVSDGERTSEWTSRGTAVADAQCTARAYRVLEHDGIFIYHMEDPRSVENAEFVASLSARLLRLYSERYRAIEEYPQYHIAEMPNFASDISSGNTIGLTSATWHTIASEEHPKTTLAHEYVHPFVIPVVPREDPLYALGLEGFPSYFHLPILAEVLGEEWYRGYMARVEEAYLRKKEAGREQRSTRLPPDKPLAALTADEVPAYKDTFLLNDRARLFLHYLLTEMGRESFWRFTRALCESKSMDLAKFKLLIEAHLPGSGEDVRVWLEETDYPERLRLAERPHSP